MKNTATLALLAAGFTGCSDATGPMEREGDTAASFASSALGASAGLSAIGPFLTDPHTGGAADGFELVEITFGRAVEVWAHDARGVLVRVAADLVIGPDYRGDGVESWVDEHPVRGVDRLMIDVNVDERRAGGGRDRFLAAVESAATTAVPLRDAGVDGSGVLSQVPRNAALSLRFSDLVDTFDLAASAPQLFVGSPAVVPFDVRVVPDLLHGGLAAQGSGFHTTRLIVDLAVRKSEQSRAQRPLALSPTGLPAARGDGASAVLRLPTAAVPLLTNLAGQPLGVGMGSVDFAAPTLDIVRPFHAGALAAVGRGAGASTSFLGSSAAPVLVTRVAMSIVAAPVQQAPGGTLFTLPRIEFQGRGCAAPAQIGDVIRQPDLVAEVVADSGPLTGFGLDNVLVRLLEFPVQWPGPGEWVLQGVGPGDFDAPYDLLMDDSRVACLVHVDPAPLGAPGAPTRGVQPGATFALRFNEPIDAASLGDLDAALLGRSAIDGTGPVDPRDVVVSELQVALDGESLQVVPVLPLAHAQGTSEVYWITPRIGVGAVRDLAGNALLETPGPIAMSIDPAAAPEQTDSLLFRFADADELAPDGPDWGGQMVHDSVEQRVRPRPVVRFAANIDGSQPIVNNMTQLPFGLQAPLNGLGARLQTLWRYADMGLALTDPATINIDVESLSWAPSGGVVSLDTFAEFEIRLSHSTFAPDEVVDPQSLFPAFQGSGLESVFESNRLSFTDPKTVHDRARGYDIDPADVYQSPTGQSLIRYPLNQGLPAGQHVTYTWRDSQIRERGGRTTSGVDPRAYLVALGLPVPSIAYYRATQVRTIGLPLLMDFLTWPDANANGLNGLRTALAVNSSSRPYFRAFSAGGVDQMGNTILVDPEQEVSANGGFNPGSTPPGGQTFGRDNAVYFGAADFVVRKSLAHSVWFELGADNPQRTVVEPIAAPSVQPLGTVVAIDLRGASRIDYLNGPGASIDNDSNNDGIVDYTADANTIELYGDYYNDVEYDLNHDAFRQNPGLTFLGATDEWQTDVSALNGARWVQLRIRAEANIASGAVPSVSAIGIAWRE